MFDLLNARNKLNILEDGKKNVVVVGLKELRCRDVKMVQVRPPGPGPGQALWVQAALLRRQLDAAGSHSRGLPALPSQAMYIAQRNALLERMGCVQSGLAWSASRAAYLTRHSARRRSAAWVRASFPP